MKSKGFTLIELLAIITVLTILTLLISTNVVNRLKKAQKKVDEISYAINDTAIDFYFSNRQDEYPKRNGATYCLVLSTLVNDEVIKLPYKLGSITLTEDNYNTYQNWNIKAKYNSGYSFSLVENCTEVWADPPVKPEPSDTEFCTGSYPDDCLCQSNTHDPLELNSSYSCKFDSEEYTFYLTSKANNTLTLTSAPIPYNPISINCTSVSQYKSYCDLTISDAVTFPTNNTFQDCQNKFADGIQSIVNRFSNIEGIIRYKKSTKAIQSAYFINSLNDYNCTVISVDGYDYCDSLNVNVDCYDSKGEVTNCTVGTNDVGVGVEIEIQNSKVKID